MKLVLIFHSLFGRVFYPLFLRFSKGVLFGRNLKVKGWPYIHVSSNSKIFIGDNVTLNSSNYGYHINMHSSVKLFVEGENSVIKIGNNTRIHGSCIHATKQIEIGDNCLIAANCHIIDSNGHSASMDRPELRLTGHDSPKSISIGNNVWIGANCIILKGVRIGDGSIISAGSVVSSDIPENVVAVGNPAIVLRKSK